MIEIKERNSYCERFRDVFHFELKDVSEIDVYQWKTLISLDVVKFEEKMKERWYDENKESLKDYVVENYWEDTSNFIFEII